MSTYTGTQDPDAVLDWTLDWTDWLVTGDTISTATATPATGLTLDSDSNTTTAVTAWLSGGTLGVAYDVVYHIVTAAGREDDRTLRITIRNK